MQSSLFEPGRVVSVVLCVARKLRPCPSYSRRTYRINLGLWRSLYKGGGYMCLEVSSRCPPPPGSIHKLTPASQFLCGMVTSSVATSSPIPRPKTCASRFCTGPKNANQKPRTTLPSTQATTRLYHLCSAVTHHTTQRILHAVESSDYQGTANNPHRQCLIEGPLAPFYQSQRCRLLWKAEALSVDPGNCQAHPHNTRGGTHRTPPHRPPYDYCPDLFANRGHVFCRSLGNRFPCQ